MDKTPGWLGFGFESSLFPGHDIGQADVTNPSTSLERKFARPHRVQDGLASHPLHFPHLLHRQPSGQYRPARWHDKTIRPRWVGWNWRCLAFGLVWWPDSDRRFLDCLVLRLFQHVSP